VTVSATFSAASDTTTARDVLRAVYGFHLNVLAVHQALSADLAQRGLEALNMVVDEVCGYGGPDTETSFTSMPLAGSEFAAADAWPGMRHDAAGKVLFVHKMDGVDRQELRLMPYDQFHRVQPDNDPMAVCFPFNSGKALFSRPLTGEAVTVGVEQPFVGFADLQTGYKLPSGYKAALAVLTAHMVSESTVGGISASLNQAAGRARTLFARSYEPGFSVGTGLGACPAHRVNRPF
jgi:hypothetical protein